MRRAFTIALTLIAGSVALWGCVKTVAVRGDSQGLASGGGGVAFGFRTAETQPPIRWVLTIARLDPDGRTLSGLSTYKGLPTSVRHSEADFRTEKSDFAFYNLAPGEYAITAVVPFEPQPQFHQPIPPHLIAEAATTHGLIGAGMVSLMIASDRAREQRETAALGPRKPSELIFAENGLVKENAPRFAVRQGQVAYIGDFLFGAHRYEIEVEGLAGGITTVEGENNEII